MGLKYVYALVSGEKDYYAEQAMVSMHTLRQHNPGCHIVLATDDETLKVIESHHSRILEYVIECISINAPEGFTPVQRSRYVKTLIRRYVKGDFLYLDCDTIIMDSLAALENFEGDVAGTLFHHIRHWDKSVKPDRLTNFYKQTKIKEQLDFSFYCNGGVILCKDNENGHRLFDAWHNYWLESSTKYGYDFDQVNLWRANASLGGIMVELDGAYNCQIIYVREVRKHIDECKVLHYQTNSERIRYLPFKNPSVLENIRRNGITSEIEEMIRTLMHRYRQGLIVLDDEESRVYELPMSVLGRKLARDYAWTNKVAKFVYKLFGFNI